MPRMEAKNETKTEENEALVAELGKPAPFNGELYLKQHLTKEKNQIIRIRHIDGRIYRVNWFDQNEFGIPGLIQNRIAKSLMLRVDEKDGITPLAKQ
jgi:hypothetical protein